MKSWVLVQNGLILKTLSKINNCSKANGISAGMSITGKGELAGLSSKADFFFLSPNNKRKKPD